VTDRAGDRDALRVLNHDIRSPLVVISGFAQILAGEGDLTDEQRREYAGRILTAAGELQSLVDRTLA
jgi:signal transduction histidine kinase